MKKLFCVMLALTMLSACSKKEETSTNTQPQGCDAFETCGSSIDTEAAKSFKESYEALNGTTTKSGKTYRTVTIAEDNPFVEITGDEAAEKIKSGEDFYLYIGDEMCPWCRSVVEQAIASAKEAGITTIYYVQIWDNDGNEILRDQYKLNDGKAELSVEPTEAYKTMLEAFASVLDEYTLTDDSGNTVDVGEKRIYAPSFFHVANGTSDRMTTAISASQDDPYMELSEQIMSDQKAAFTELFNK